jgi:PAS domain S-box-containing protein
MASIRIAKYDIGVEETVTIPRAEYEKLLASKTLISQVADSAPSLIWLSGTDALCTWFNKPWLDFRGRTMEQEMGNGWAEGVHREDFDRCLEIYLSNFEARTPFQMEYRLRRADGEFRWLLDHGVPRFSEDGNFLGFIGACTDINDLYVARQAQLEQSKRLAEHAAIVDSSDDVILSKDLNGIIRSWNSAASRLFGYSAEEMIGESILKLIPEHLKHEEKTIIDNIRAGRRVEHFDTVRRAKDGILLDVSVTVSPVKDEQGHVVGASKILRSISDRKKLEQALLQAEKIAATGRMAATIAHEVNNPLEAVMNLLYILRSKVTDEEGLAHLSTAESEITRVSHIAKQTLGYYREHAAASAASLSEIAQEVVPIYEPRCVAANIKVNTFFRSSRKPVVRRGEMMQVVSNVIANSIYAMPQGGTIDVEVSDSEVGPKGVNLLVRDNGTGVSPENLPRIFDAFFTTRATIGTGIGLFVAKQFIEGHGGEISIESNQDTEAHGTTVRIFLPLKTNYEVSQIKSWN